MTVFKPGDRVHLKGHPHTTHTTGTVRSVDALGVHVLWDDGEVVTTQLPLYLEPAGEPMAIEQHFTGRNGAELEVTTMSAPAGHFGIDVHDVGMQIPDELAPAIALAILEAAGYVADIDDASILVNSAMGRLAMHVTTEAAKAKEAADREALEAEALELFNALREANDNNLVDGFHDIPTSHQGTWLAVAKTSRHLHGVTK